MTKDRQPQQGTLTEAPAEVGLSVDLFAPAASNLPATTQTTAVATADNAGGLTYQTATPEEQQRMDQIIAGIDLTNPETIVTLGKEERERLANMADSILNSIDSQSRIDFAVALKGLVEAIRSNSIEEIKKRLKGGVGKAFMGAVSGLFGGKDRDEKKARELIESFMADTSKSRKTIEEMTSKLQEQQKTLEQNVIHINNLGNGMNTAAQDMRIVRAATNEYIRRVNSGEITTLIDLEAKARETGRADDAERLQLAQASWNNLRVVDGDLLASIGVYEMGCGNLAFTKQANLQNRIQTLQTLTTSVSEWKIQLGLFQVVTTEQAAAKLLDLAGSLSSKAVQENSDLFDELVNLTVGRSAKGTYNLKDIINAQSRMATTMSTVGDKIEAQFKELDGDKAALEQSSAAFKRSMIGIHSYPKGVMAHRTAAPAPAPGR